MAKFDIATTSYLRPAISRTSLYSSYTTFKEYHISKSGLSNLELVCQDSSSTAYHIETALYNQSKRDLTIHLGQDNKGLVLGNVDLKHFSGYYTIELGDMQHDPVVLEDLDGVKGWNSSHSFEFVFGGENGKGKREAYVWRHPGEKLLSNRDDLELVTTCGEEDGEEEVVLAQYLKGGGSHGWKSKGGLLIREGGGRSWELVVILTVLALVVSRRREQ
jgi:hypothetical protein